MAMSTNASSNEPDLSILEPPAKKRKLEPSAFDLNANFPTLEDVSCRICMNEPCPRPIWRCSSSPMHFLCNACWLSLQREACPYCRVPFGIDDRVRFTELEQYIDDKFLNQYICKFPGCTARFTTEADLKHHQQLECGYLCPISDHSFKCCGKTGFNVRDHFYRHAAELIKTRTKLEIDLRRWKGGRAFVAFLSDRIEANDHKDVLVVATREYQEILVESWASPSSSLYSHRVLVSVVFETKDQKMTIPFGYCVIRPFVLAGKTAPPADNRRKLLVNYERLTSILLLFDASKLNMRFVLELQKPDVINLDDDDN